MAMPGKYVDNVDKSLQDLRKFLASRGVTFGKISSLRIPGQACRGIVATADIEPNETILCVPRRILMGIQSALEDEVIARAVERVSGKEGLCISDQQLLAIHLLNECSKKEQSFWYPYISTLPRSYSTGCSLRDAHIEEVQFSYAKRFLYQAKDECAALYRGALSVLRVVLDTKSKWTTLHAWKWALSTLSSRTMFMPGDSIGILCPYGDLHNFSSPPPPITPHLEGLDQGLLIEDEKNISGEGYYDPDRDMYVLVSRRMYTQGEQVFLCYGRHTNLHLLRYYGFCLEDNPHNTALIPIIHFSKSVQQHIGLEEDAYLHNNGYPSFQLMRALRMASLDARERKLYAFKVLNDDPVHPSSEILAFSMLVIAVQKTLEEGTTTMETDLSLLNVPGIDERMYAIIQWRLYHKNVLQRCLRLSKRYIDIQMNTY